MAEGIDIRHSRSCRSRDGGRCNCNPTYRARVWDDRRQKRHMKTFPTSGAAKAWRSDMLVAIRRGDIDRLAPSPASSPRLRDEAATFLAGAESGAIRNRSGEPYKPSAARGYRRALDLRVLPELGECRIGEIRRADVQELVNGLLAGDVAPSTVRNTLDPLRAIFRRAVARGAVSANPTEHLEVPHGDGGRERIAGPQEAVALLGALPDEDRALWATAMYAGLRRGELRGLQWEDVDLDGGVIHVRRSWDDEAGEITVKTKAGKRTVPVASSLRRELAAHKLRTGRDGPALVFGTTDRDPFTPSTARRRARSAWGWKEIPNPDGDRPPTVWARAREDALDPITLHECRHTFASLRIAADAAAGYVNMKELSAHMGHASVTITLDRYGHLLPGGERQAAERLDAFLDGATSQPVVVKLAEAAR